MKADFVALKKLLAEAKKELIEKIEDIDFSIEGVKKVSSNPKCFTVSMSAIANNNFILSPSYYSVDDQKKRIIALFENTDDIFTCFNRLKAVSEKKRFSDGTPCHPEIVSSIKKVLEECNVE